ncbi:MAG: TetR/AcrR family transcriptional regulator [Telluria sp.]
MPAATNQNDHRPRVAAERRERMRRRLVESAMIVFAEKGVGASVIPDVVAAAEVSQGSFYNYFRTNEDLLAAVSNELSDEMAVLIEAVAGNIAEPPLKVASAIRSYLHLTRSHRLLARFLAGAGLRLAGAGHETRQRSAAYDFLTADIGAGQARGDFAAVPLEVAVDVVKGAMLVAIDRMARARTARDYPEKITAAILRALGVPAGRADQLVASPLPKMAPAADSLLARVQARVAAKVPAAG